MYRKLFTTYTVWHSPNRSYSSDDCEREVGKVSSIVYVGIQPAGAVAYIQAKPAAKIPVGFLHGRITTAGSNRL